MNKAELLKNSYYNWLNEELTFTEQDNYVEITTPFLDSVFDNICIYAKFAKENSVELSDFGQTLFNLEGQGISIQEKKKYGIVSKLYLMILEYLLKDVL